MTKFLYLWGIYLKTYTYMKNMTVKMALLVGAALFLASCTGGVKQTQTPLQKIEGDTLTYILPSPLTDGTVSVEKALSQRRSHRKYLDAPLPAEQLSQILWAAYGITVPRTDRAFMRGGLRTAPSAGALYPFEIYAVVGNVKGVEPGVYRYIADGQKMQLVVAGDVREQLCEIALNQTFIKEAPVTIFYTAIFSRMTTKYGERGRERYVCIDLGHSAENIYLQAEALNLGCCAVGAFYDDKVSELLKLSEEEEPLYLLTVGYKN